MVDFFGLQNTPFTFFGSQKSAKTHGGNLRIFDVSRWAAKTDCVVMRLMGNNLFILGSDPLREAHILQCVCVCVKLADNWKNSKLS